MHIVPYTTQQKEWQRQRKSRASLWCTYKHGRDSRVWTTESAVEHVRLLLSFIWQPCHELNRYAETCQWEYWTDVFIQRLPLLLCWKNSLTTQRSTIRHCCMLHALDVYDATVGLFTLYIWNHRILCIHIHTDTHILVEYKEQKGERERIAQVEKG